MSKKKQKIKVGFTEWQYAKVHAFLDWLRVDGRAEIELGRPLKVTVDWSDQNDEGYPHVRLQGPVMGKSIPLKQILEADDSKLPAPVLRSSVGDYDGGLFPSTPGEDH